MSFGLGDKKGGIHEIFLERIVAAFCQAPLVLAEVFDEGVRFDGLPFFATGLPVHMLQQMEVGRKENICL